MLDEYTQLATQTGTLTSPEALPQLAARYPDDSCFCVGKGSLRYSLAHNYAHALSEILGGQIMNRRPILSLCFLDQMPGFVYDVNR